MRQSLQYVWLLVNRLTERLPNCRCHENRRFTGLSTPFPLMWLDRPPTVAKYADAGYPEGEGALTG